MGAWGQGDADGRAGRAHGREAAGRGAQHWLAPFSRRDMHDVQPPARPHLAPQRRVPVVFDRVVGAPLEVLSHASPLRQGRGRSAGARQVRAWTQQVRAAQGCAGAGGQEQAGRAGPLRWTCRTLPGSPGPSQHPPTHLVAMAAVEPHDCLVLLPAPAATLYVGVQVVVPPAGGSSRRHVGKQARLGKAHAAGGSAGGAAGGARVHHRSGSPAHRSRHCLPMRPGRCSAIMVHFWGPCSATSLRARVGVGAGVSVEQWQRRRLERGGSCGGGMLPPPPPQAGTLQRQQAAGAAEPRGGRTGQWPRPPQVSTAPCARLG